MNNPKCFQIETHELRDFKKDCWLLLSFFFIIQFCTAGIIISTAAPSPRPPSSRSRWLRGWSRSCRSSAPSRLAPWRRTGPGSSTWRGSCSMWRESLAVRSVPLHPTLLLLYGVYSHILIHNIVYSHSHIDLVGFISYICMWLDILRGKFFSFGDFGFLRGKIRISCNMWKPITIPWLGLLYVSPCEGGGLPGEVRQAGAQSGVGLERAGRELYEETRLDHGQDLLPGQNTEN